MLFLSSFHTFSQLAVGHAFAARFRKGFDKRDNSHFHARLCDHTFVGRDDVLPCIDKTGAGTAARDLFVPCQNELSACHRCLSDFETTITWHVDGNEVETDEERINYEEFGRWSVHRLYHVLLTWSLSVTDRLELCGGYKRTAGTCHFDAATKGRRVGILCWSDPASVGRNVT